MAFDKSKLKVLIFDLDDTLFDTDGLLVQPAHREACEAMIGAGLNATLDEALAKRTELFDQNPRRPVYADLVKNFGVLKGSDATVVEKVGFEAFHNRPVNEQIHLFEGALDTLKGLKAIYHLHLVTLGHVATQFRKVEKLKLKSEFLSITYVDVTLTKRKIAAFKDILESENLPSQAFAGIGNRIDGEISDANELGMQTILFKHGEYKNLAPKNKFEIPDAEVSDWISLRKLLL
ncbi:MAG: HAD hydrolase-like protein [Oligoflexia bacterium]|nr:HAD hydrolase-like protein [Oligoflexia bacterium]